MKKPVLATEHTEAGHVVMVNGLKTGKALKGGDAVLVMYWLKQAWAELMRNAKTPPPPKDVEG